MARQSEIPGTERPVNKRMEGLIGELVGLTKKKTKATQDVKKADDAINRALIEEGLPEYTSEEHGKTVKLEQKTRYSNWSPPEPESAESDAPRGKRGKKSNDDAEGGEGLDS